MGLVGLEKAMARLIVAVRHLGLRVSQLVYENSGGRYMNADNLHPEES